MTWRALSAGPYSRVGTVMLAPLLQSTPATASDLANLLAADASAPDLAGGSF